MEGRDVELWKYCVIFGRRCVGRILCAGTSRRLSIFRPALRVVRYQARIIVHRLYTPLSVFLNESIFIDALCPLGTFALFALHTQLVHARLGTLAIGGNADIGLKQNVFVHHAGNGTLNAKLIQRVADTCFTDINALLPSFERALFGKQFSQRTPLVLIKIEAVLML